MPSGRRVTHEEYVDWVAQNRPEVTVLGRYEGASTKTLHLCEGGHEWLVDPRFVKSGQRCAICTGQLPEPYNEWLAENRPGVECLDTYANATTKLRHICENGHAFEMTPSNMKSSTSNGCKTCQYNASRKWTLETCLADAKRYATRSDWFRGNQFAYTKAREHGWFAQCTEHMERANGHDNDSIYCWLVTDAPAEIVRPLLGFHLVKFGVTSKKLGPKRIRQVASDNRMAHEVIAQCDTSDGDATYFESELLKLGTNAGVPYHYDGYTEFRIISDDELAFVRELLGTEQVAMAA